MTITNDRNIAADLDVVVLGSPLVDILTHGDDKLVIRLGLEKGTMQLVSAERAEEIYDALGPATEASGGSGANTAAGVASFGGNAGFIGRVADDTFGRLFVHDLRNTGVTYEAPFASDGLPTGRCLVIVTPDAQRTMCTFLGAATEFEKTWVDEDLVQRGSILYIEGYLYDTPAAQEAIRLASAAARRAGRLVAFTLSDPFAVERHRDEFHELVENEIDILFANEHEICSLYDVDSFDDALQHVRGHCEIAALTRGALGSVIVRGDEVHVIDPEPVQVVDTTGAGDLYAAGFIYGFTRGLDLATCGRLASLGAGEVISHLGPRPEVKLASLAGPLLA